MTRMRFVNLLPAVVFSIWSLTALGSSYQVLYNFTGVAMVAFPSTSGRWSSTNQRQYLSNLKRQRALWYYSGARLLAG